MIENRNDYILYRFNRAKESFEEALILAGNNKWKAVINRLYYACFYAVISLLLKSEIETQSHDGARRQFSLHFVKTGKVSKENGKLFSKLFDYRQKGDYGDLFDFDEETVKPLMVKTQEFIIEIETHLL
ncbi:MAG TPA: HEPN domain-containing protein [Ignavibacteria bacterium]|nr:HEPN domain-containing protein [Ignavibacteria bacterium]